jgi:hypothetical protein
MSVLDSLEVKLCRGDGPFWGWAKRSLKSLRRCHVPVGPITKPLFAVGYRFHVLTRSLVLTLLRILWFEPICKSQCRTVGAGFVMEKLVFLTGVGDITIGANVTLSGKSNFGFCCSVLERPSLTIGDATFLGHNCSIYVAEAVHNGARCLIAGDVIIRDYDGHPINSSARKNHQPVLHD